MNSFRPLVLSLALALAASGLAGREEVPRVAVNGDVEHRLSLSNADLRQRFAGEMREVSFTLKKLDGHAHAVPLLSLIQAASPKLNPKRKHAPLAVAVVVEGEDGYAATFGMGDLTPELGHEVWAAVDWNDGPLAPEDGPIRLIVPGDAKPARWVQGVRTIRVVDLAPKKVKLAPPAEM